MAGFMPSRRGEAGRGEVWEVFHRTQVCRLVTGIAWHDEVMESMLIGMKFSANIPPDALAYLDAEVEAGRFRSRSAALTEAVYVLREAGLQSAYAEAFRDSDPLWDQAASDGLDGHR
jgi:Arc/MetJ-type ribon-helix-helix transcriptional regulator